MCGKCDPQRPSSYPRRVLVATLGLAPQVLTETIYCLATSKNEPFVPTEIHVITTVEGAHRAQLTLLDPSTAALERLARDYGIEELSSVLKPENLHVISSEQGELLDDIDSANDNIAAADMITGIIRELASGNNSALHVSIAGGRKTMGFLLGYALSIFGRPQDRLSHVLVSKPFQDHPEFFFPPREPVVLRDRENRPVTTADANLILADIPVVHLRDHLPDALLSGSASYSDTVRQAQMVFSSPKMAVDHANTTLHCHDIPVKLPPATFALAAWFARQQSTNVEAKQWIHWQTGDWNNYSKEYAAIPELSDELIARMTSRFSKANNKGDLDDDRKAFFYEHLSRLRRELKRKLGPLLPKYQPETSKRPGKIGVKFPIKSNAIYFI